VVFEVLILGSSSATPIYQRHPSAQLLNIHERFFLVDCGEGTQMQLNRYKIKYPRIHHIFISHLHGDHYFGLMGLLSSMHLQGRTDEMHLYCPKELQEIIDIQLKYSDTRLRFNLIYHFTDHETSKTIFEDDDLTVETIILNHRIPCTGFLFREKPKKRKLLREKLEQYHVPREQYSALKSGQDYVNDRGVVIPNEKLTDDPKAPCSYAYCSDTMYDERIIPQIKNVDLLYHESTFLEDKADRAKETFHTTARQAGLMARKAEVKRLIIGHFSSRYKDIYPLLEEAKQVFPDTSLAQEGDKFIIE